MVHPGGSPPGGRGAIMGGGGGGDELLTGIGGREVEEDLSVTV
tara:strand:- start:47 stop:175 length:129 start_codon:yes stop_codon:yes gene_type:complete